MSLDPLVRRLAAVTGAEWSVAGILNEVLPEQRSLCNARCLLESRQPHSKVLDIKRPQAFENKRKRYRSVVPLQIVSSAPKQPAISHPNKRSNLETSSDSFRGHVLSVWEDKFRLKSLAVEDALLLLAQPNVASTLESASFLREVRLTYEQVMELEMALATLRRQNECADFHSPKRSSSGRRATMPLCKMLARNAWHHSRTFSVAQTLPEVITFKRLASSSSTQASTAFSSTRARPKYTSKLHDKGYDTSQLSIKQASRVECIPIGPNPVSYQKVCPQSIRDWVRDHCMEEVARSVTIRQNFAVEKLYIIFSKHCYQAKHRRFSRWLQQVTWMQCDEQIRRFCRLKCALWVLQKSRKKLEKLVFCLWSRWMVDTVHQREDETIAAAVTIQSWVRSVKGKRTAAVRHLHEAATSIQAGWRGFYCRKMFKRRKRFYAYHTAAHHVQRCYHSHIFRERLDAWMRYQSAARVITRALKHYIVKKRDFVAWCHRLARYHAIIAIQVWTRRTITRIRCANTKRERLAKARQVVLKFLRRSRFVRCFAVRVDRTLKRKTAAAVLLQNAYRAKQARARFYELKVRLEDQRRQEILTTMWNNAYATTIQKWWRKQKYLQRRQQQSPEGCTTLVECNPLVQIRQGYEQPMLISVTELAETAAMTPTSGKTPQKSTLSRAIGRESVGQVDFGRRWQSEVYDLGVVMIDAADAIIAVRCVFRCDLAPIPDSSLVCSRGVQHTFVLMKHEFIERLHVRTSANTLVSLKIWTNLRSSQWFGGTGKWQDHDHYNVEEIAAPQGWYVSSFYGSHVGQRCNQLGCRFDLLSRSSRMDPIQVDLSKQQSKTSPVTIREADIDGKPFFYSHMQLQAVAITCSSHLRAISIVSDEQYNRYLRDRESALGPNEHLLELIAGERIQRVDVCHSSSALVGLRLTTTLRTTQWFGSADSGSITSLSSEQGYVCGFFGTRDTSGICSLGAVCQLETPPQDASKDIARWDAMRDELLPVKFPTSF